MNNKKLGNGAESELLKVLRGYGFWCHLLKDSASGQPFDIIATYEDNAFYFDSKTLLGANNFPFTRIEDNQVNSFEDLKKVGCYRTAFVIFKDFQFRVLTYAKYIEQYKLGKVSIPFKTLPLLSDYLRECLGYVSK